MPRTKTAKKEARKNIRRRAKNNSKKDALRTVIKTYERALASGGKADISLVYKALDKATKSRIIKANKASRLKSRLSRKTKKESK